MEWDWRLPFVFKFDFSWSVVDTATGTATGFQNPASCVAFAGFEDLNLQGRRFMTAEDADVEEGFVAWGGWWIESIVVVIDTWIS